MNPKSTNIAYWIITTILLLPLLASGLGFIAAPPPIMEGMRGLGYPPYLMRFLGLAKVLAVLAIAAGSYPRIKEWAYAGLTFLLLGAAYSHVRVGEMVKASAPLILLIVLGFSYSLWKRQTYPIAAEV